MRRKNNQLVPFEKSIIESAKQYPDGFYGYQLSKVLDVKHNGTLYRALRRLEEMGYLESRTETSNADGYLSPARRVYKLKDISI